MKDNTEFQDAEDIQDQPGYLPGWWMGMFYVSIAFAIVYGVYLHGIAGWSQEKQYREEAAKITAAHPVETAALNAEGMNPFRGNASAVANGEKIFSTTCGVCHKVDGTGLIGPSLVDGDWLHGKTDRDVFQVVMEGITQDNLKQSPPKGPMPAHKNSLGPKKALEVMAHMAKLNPGFDGK